MFKPLSLSRIFASDNLVEVSRHVKNKRSRSEARSGKQSCTTWSCPLLAIGTFVTVYIYWLAVAVSSENAMTKHSPENVDIVGLILKPTCTTVRAIKALNAFQRPARIYVITPDVDSCVDKLQAVAENVKCLNQDQVLPGLSFQSVGDKLKGMHPEAELDNFEHGRTAAGWYLQQIIKLGVAQSLKELSSLYVVWDLDMIPLRRLPWLHSKHQHQLSSQDEASPVVVNIGGARSDGYDMAYEQLFGRPMDQAPDGTSFVTHSMVVRKKLMLEFLEAMSRPNLNEYAWVDRIFESIPVDYVSQGFSEFASYISWVGQTYPETQYIMPTKTWLRNPVGGAWGYWVSRISNRNGLCCPTSFQLGLHWLMGYQYTGFEMGHIDSCNWLDPKYERSYGV